MRLKNLKFKYSCNCYFPKISNDLKNSSGSEALNKNNIVCNAIKLIKDTIVN